MDKKELNKIRNRDYYIKNKERLILINKKNYLKNFEKTKKHRAEYNKEWRMNNKEKVNIYRGRYKEKQKEYYKNNKDKRNKYLKDNIEKVRGYKLKYAYNIGVDLYNELFIKQNGCCAICGKHQNELPKILCVDHDHVTNKIRGLLCSKCNLMLGHSYENINTLKKAIQYLKENDKD